MDRVSLEVFGTCFDPRREATTKAGKEYWRTVDALALETEDKHGVCLSSAWYCAHGAIVRARSARFWGGNRTKLTDHSELLPFARELVAERVSLYEELDEAA